MCVINIIPCCIYEPLTYSHRLLNVIFVGGRGENMLDGGAPFYNT